MLVDIQITVSNVGGGGGGAYYRKQFCVSKMFDKKSIKRGASEIRRVKEYCMLNLC